MAFFNPEYINGVSQNYHFNGKETQVGKPKNPPRKQGQQITQVASAAAAAAAPVALAAATTPRFCSLSAAPKKNSGPLAAGIELNGLH